MKLRRVLAAMGCAVALTGLGATGGVASAANSQPASSAQQEQYQQNPYYWYYHPWYNQNYWYYNSGNQGIKWGNQYFCYIVFSYSPQC